MKSPFSLFIFFTMFVSTESFGQGIEKAINTNWNQLKFQLRERTDVIINLVTVLSKSAVIDKEYLEKSRAFALDLHICLDTIKSLDSSSIALISGKSNQLTQAISRMLVSLENDQQFRNRSEVSDVMSKLELCEKRIYLAGKEYNDSCIKYNRVELHFGRYPKEKPPKVDFRQK